MSEAVTNIEGLLRQALSPVDPPEGLAERMQSTLENITELAAEELDAWELSAMRDPRNWVRPAVAAVAGGTAGAALMVIRARQRQQHRLEQSAGVRDFALRTLQDLEREARRLIDG